MAVISPAKLKVEARKYSIIAGKELGVNPDWIYAQWAHETGGFSSQLALRNFNLAGITVRGTPGEWRSYSSLEEFTKDYVNIIKSSYPGVPGSETLAQFIYGLSKGKSGSWFGSEKWTSYYEKVKNWLFKALPGLQYGPLGGKSEEMFEEAWTGGQKVADKIKNFWESLTLENAVRILLVLLAVIVGIISLMKMLEISPFKIAGRLVK